MANARTAVVVKKSPTAAVAVNSEIFILEINSKIIIIFFDGSCIRKYFWNKFIFVLFRRFEEKKGLKNVRPGDGEPYF